jgi:hypothetical protein
MDSLAQIQDRLLALQPDAAFDEPEGLRAWFNPEVAELFLAHAIEHPADMRVYKLTDAPPLQCHTTALTLATQRPDLLSWFGFILTWEPEYGGWRFWHHSRCTDFAMTTRYEGEPSASLGRRFIGCIWSKQLYAAIDKKPGTPRRTELPPALNRDITTQPIPDGGRRWVEGH